MKRGQAALEYLSTYGWAFMVVLIMIGAIAYMGVTDVKTLVPERCQVPQGFGCEDFQLLYTQDAGGEGSEVSFVLTNQQKNTVYLNKTVITYDGFTSSSDFCGVYRALSDTGQGTPQYTLQPGAKVEVICNVGATRQIKFPLPGEKEQVTFTFTYKLTQDGFDHRVDGEIVGVVQSP